MRKSLIIATVQIGFCGTGLTGYYLSDNTFRFLMASTWREFATLQEAMEAWAGLPH